MERDELVAVFYGEGAVPPPWATDCPVRFDVWFQFAQPGGLDKRVDLILAINEEHGLAQVLEYLRNPTLFPLAQPLASGGFIAAKLTLSDMVALLSMTSLWRQVEMAKQLGPDLVAALQSAVLPIPRVPPPILPPPAEEDERKAELSDHLVWFLRLLRTVAGGALIQVGSAASGPLDRSAAETIAAPLLVQMLTHAPGPITPLPNGVPVRGKTIDRRRRYPIVSITTNRKASAAVTRSRTTIKADAAEQLFSVDCSSIGWAVVDSGIDTEHPCFADWDASGVVPLRLGTRVVRAYDLVNARERLSLDLAQNGLIDWIGALPYLEMAAPGAPAGQGNNPPYSRPVDPHGTHVAGILGGWWPERAFRGVCPTIRLYDFRVLDANGQGDEFSIVAALQAIRYINEQSGRLVIAGVNLSLAVPHDVAAYTCGWTPVCVECDKLVRSGVVVVTSAGNAGFTGATRTIGTGYNTVSISDPGNTDSVITVGSTHRSDPHRNGVSYFSSRGPTADGRSKPDILAPGEDIDGPVPNNEIAAMHGTSQAAAHVSGAAAMLVARYRELLGRPERVKSILCNTATDLGRERSFQGSGLVDVLRAMQSI
jgi:hypothetical protein